MGGKKRKPHGPRANAATNQMKPARDRDRTLSASSLNEIPQDGNLVHQMSASSEDVGLQAAIKPDINPKEALRDNAPILVNMDPEKIMSVLEQYLTPDEKECTKEFGKPSSLGIINTISRQLEGDKTRGYEALLKGLAGLHTNLFEEYTGRKPQSEEADFVMKNFKQGLKEAILKEGHKADHVTDHKINLDENYVELRIVPVANQLEKPKPGTSHKHDHLPKLYQSHTGQIQSSISALHILDIGSNINKTGAGAQQIRRVVNLHGRAGIGKSTTLQWLLRKWAQGEWATSYSIVFLIPLRRLLTCKTPISLIDMLTSYNLYRTKEGQLHPEWLLSNQMRVFVSLDGLDEMNLSRNDICNAPEITDIHEKSSPLHIAINLIRGNLLPDSTLINCSRHSEVFSEIPQCQSFEIQGLNQEGVLSFIKRSYESDAVERIEKVLRGRPLLFSVCSITYYCSVITRLLNDDPTLTFEGVNTYTRLHSFIIQKFASRSLESDYVALELQHIFPKLAKMAYQGMFGQERVWSQIIFQEKDMISLGMKTKDIDKAIKLGILVHAYHEKNAVQFFHLSLQEFLAVAYMIMDETNWKQSKVQELKDRCLENNMDLAILYMFGFKYDNDNSWRHHILGEAGKKSTEEHMQEYLKDILQHASSKGSSQMKMVNNLFCCQLAYESQSQNIAKEVADHIITSGDFILATISITALEIEAMTFTFQQITSLKKLELVQTNLDAISVTMIAEFLKKDRSIELLNLSSNQIEQQGMSALCDMIVHNNSLRTLILDCCSIEDEGILTLVEGLHKNTTLNHLSLKDNLICDKGGEALAQSIKVTRAMIILGLSLNHISHVGINALNDTFNQLNQMYKNLKRDDIKLTYDLSSNPCDLNLCKKRFQGFKVSRLQVGLLQNCSKLARAKTIHLHDACLKDEDIQKISAFVQNSEVVEEVFLENNSLTPLSLPFLNGLAFTCKSLKRINLSGNAFQPETVELFMDLSVRAKLKSLILHFPSGFPMDADVSQVATLQTPHVSLPNVCSIISSRARLQCLTLNAYFMPVMNRELKCIEEIIKHCHEMMRLSLKGTLFIWENFETLFSCMQDLKALECIEFAQCVMHIASLEKLLDTIGLMPWLKEVTIFQMVASHSMQSQLSNPLKIPNERSINWRTVQRMLKAVEKLCMSMQHFTQLAVLTLSHPSLSDTCARSISQLLFACPMLQSLCLTDCKIGSRGCEHLARALGKNKGLQKLSLDRNPLGDDGVKFLSEGIMENKTLLSLSIQDSGFSDSGVEYLSKALEVNSTLQALDLRGCSIDLGAEALRDSLKVNKFIILLGMPFIMDLTVEEEILEHVKRNNSPSPLKQ